MENLSTEALAWCAASLFLAGFVKGVAGIGIPLVGVSLLSLVIPVPQAVALLPVPIVIANTWQAFSGGIFVATCRRYAGLLVAMIIGTVIGAALLSSVDLGVLMLSIGVIVLAFAILELARFRVRIPTRHETLAGTTVGLVGGVLGGMSSIFGPPIIMFLTSLGLDKEAFVATVSSIYLFSGFVLAATLAFFGVATPTDMLLWSSLAAAPLFVGLALGQVSRRRVSEGLFRKVLMALLVLIGLNLIRRGIG